MTLFNQLVIKHDLTRGATWPKPDPAYALVAVGSGKTMAFEPLVGPSYGQRTFGGYTTVFQVKVQPFDIPYASQLDSLGEGYAFDWSLHASFVITDPVKFVRTASDQLEGTLQSKIVDHFRIIARRHRPTEALAAETAMTGQAERLDLGYGLKCMSSRVSVKPDQTARAVKTKLRDVRDEDEVERAKQTAELERRDFRREWALRIIGDKSPHELFKTLMAMKLAGEHGEVDSVIDIYARQQSELAQIMRELLKRAKIEAWEVNDLTSKFLNLMAGSFVGSSSNTLPKPATNANPDEKPTNGQSDDAAGSTATSRRADNNW